MLKEKSELQETCLADKERITKVQEQLADMIADNKKLAEEKKVALRARPLERKQNAYSVKENEVVNEN